MERTPVDAKDANNVIERADMAKWERIMGVEFGWIREWIVDDLAACALGEHICSGTGENGEVCADEFGPAEACTATDAEVCDAVSGVRSLHGAPSYRTR